MSTLLAFVQSIADASAELPVTSVVTYPTNGKFIRLVLTCVDDALAHLTTLHQWPWLVKTVTPTNVIQTLPDVVRVRNVTLNGKRLSYYGYIKGAALPAYSSYAYDSGKVFLYNVNVISLPLVRIIYESAIVSVDKTDTAVLPIPLEYVYGLREYVMYLVHSRHVNDAKRADKHLQNALSAYDILKAREHSNLQSFNRYTGVNRR
jgi:hypothetical protein